MLGAGVAEIGRTTQSGIGFVRSWLPVVAASSCCKRFCAAGAVAASSVSPSAFGAALKFCLLWCGQCSPSRGMLQIAASVVPSTAVGEWHLACCLGAISPLPGVPVLAPRWTPVAFEDEAQRRQDSRSCCKRVLAATPTARRGKTAGSERMANRSAPVPSRKAYLMLARRLCARSCR